jgi:hypothetical protein
VTAKKKPATTDNHWWDCLTGCAVAASVQGLAVRADGAAGTPPPKKAGGRKFSDIQREKMAARNGGRWGE